MKKLLFLVALLATPALAQAPQQPDNFPGGWYNSAPFTLSTKQQSALQVDENGNLKVNVSAGGGSGGTSSTFGAAFPATGTAVGMSEGGNMVAFEGDGSGNLSINCVVGCAGGSQSNASSNVATSADNGKTVAWNYIWDGATWDQWTGAITGTVTANAGTNLNTSALALETTLGGVLTSTNFAAAFGTAGSADSQVMSVQGIASMTPLLVGDGTGAFNVIVDSGTLTAVTSITNTVTVTATNLSTNLAQIAGTATAVNNGGVSNGVQRVTIANDSTGILASIGSITTAVTPGTAAGNLGKAEDALAGSGDTGVAAWAVRADTAASTAANGDYVPLLTDANGKLWITGAGPTGAAPLSNVMYMGANGQGATGGLLKGLINCDLHAKYDASTSGSTTMVTGVSGRKVYICGFILATGGTATNVKLREGSDANCATSGADLTPAYQLVANDKIGINSSFWNGLVVSTNAYYVCVNASAANAVQAELWYTII